MALWNLFRLAKRLWADSSFSYFYKKRKTSAKKKSKNSLSIIAVNLHTYKQLTCLANLRKRNECSKSSQGKFFISELHLIELMTCCVDRSINYPWKNRKNESIKISANIRLGPIRCPISFYCFFSYVIAEKINQWVVISLIYLRVDL